MVLTPNPNRASHLQQVAGSFHFNPTDPFMKHILIRLILLLCLAAATPKARAEWFDFGKEHQQRLLKVQEELTVQRKDTDMWIAVAGALGVGCVLLLVIGTALGAKVRRHATKP